MRLLFMILIPRLLCDDVNNSDLNAEIPFDKLETMFNQDEKAIETLKNEVASKEIKVKEALEAAQKANKTLAQKKAETSMKKESLDIVNKPVLDIANQIKKADKTIKDLEESLITLTQKKDLLVANEETVLNQIKEMKVRIEKAENATRDNPGKIEQLRKEVTQADLENKVTKASEKLESAQTLYDAKKIEYDRDGCGESTPKPGCSVIGAALARFDSDLKRANTSFNTFNQKLEPKKKAIQELESELNGASDKKTESEESLKPLERKKKNIEKAKSDWTTKNGELDKAKKDKTDLEQRKGALHIDSSVQTKEFSDAKDKELEADEAAQNASKEYEKLEKELAGMKSELESKEKSFGVLSEKYETAKRENAATTKVSLFPLYVTGAAIFAAIAAAAGNVGIRCYKRKKNKIRCDEAILSEPAVKTSEELSLEKRKMDEGPDLNDTRVRLKLQEPETRRNLKLVQAPGAPYTNNPNNDTSVETVHKDEAMVAVITNKNRGTSILSAMSKIYFLHGLEEWIVFPVRQNFDRRAVLDIEKRNSLYCYSFCPKDDKGMSSSLAKFYEPLIILDPTVKMNFKMKPQPVHARYTGGRHSLKHQHVKGYEEDDTIAC